MSSPTIEPIWAVFTKPWGSWPADRLAELLTGMGFTGAEIPVRPGAHVTAETAEQELSRYVETLASAGIRTISIAADVSEPVLAGCAAAGVQLLRVMAPVTDHDHEGSVARMREQLAAIAPELDRYDVSIGVQPHHGPWVTSVLGALEVIKDLPAHQFGVIWDAAHDALAGEDPVTTLRLARSRLMVVNLKNARYEPVANPADGPTYRSWFGTGRQGMADWPRILDHLVETRWQGPICLTAQYSDAATPEAAAVLATEDLAWVRQLWQDAVQEPEATR